MVDSHKYLYCVWQALLVVVEVVIVMSIRTNSSFYSESNYMSNATKNSFYSTICSNNSYQQSQMPMITMNIMNINNTLNKFVFIFIRNWDHNGDIFKTNATVDGNRVMDIDFGLKNQLNQSIITVKC